MVAAMMHWTIEKDAHHLLREQWMIKNRWVKIQRNFWMRSSLKDILSYHSWYEGKENDFLAMTGPLCKKCFYYHQGHR